MRRVESSPKIMLNTGRAHDFKNVNRTPKSNRVESHPEAKRYYGNIARKVNIIDCNEYATFVK